MLKVLVVDDERSIRNTIGIFLGKENYDVYLAENAETAMQHATRLEFDIAISDMIMPQISGLTLLKNIQEMNPFIQFILMTGQPTAETSEEAFHLGACDYLVKPISKKALLEVVAKCARHRLSLEQNRQVEVLTR